MIKTVALRNRYRPLYRFAGATAEQVVIVPEKMSNSSCEIRDARAAVPANALTVP